MISITMIIIIPMTIIIITILIINIVRRMIGNNIANTYVVAIVINDYAMIMSTLANRHHCFSRTRKRNR